MGLFARLLGLESGGRDVVADLVEDFRAEAAQAALLRAQAERARYPHIAEALRQLADQEDRHVAMLREAILQRGGMPPAVEPPPLTGRNQWERLTAALAAARAKRRRLVDHIGRWDPEEAKVVDVLRTIEAEDGDAIPVYDGLVMRSDPQAID